jgi:hypothetical protein
MGRKARIGPTSRRGRVHLVHKRAERLRSSGQCMASSNARFAPETVVRGRLAFGPNKHHASLMMRAVPDTLIELPAISLISAPISERIPPTATVSSSSDRALNNWPATPASPKPSTSARQDCFPRLISDEHLGIPTSGPSRPVRGCFTRGNLSKLSKYRKCPCPEVSTPRAP